MTIKLAVLTTNEFGRAEARTTCWDNFIDHVATRYPRSIRSKSYREELACWNARDVDGSIYIEFDSEESMAAFILAWS